MANKSLLLLQGDVLDSRCRFTLAELSRACQVQDDFIVELVTEGIIDPVAEEAGKLIINQRSSWQFTGADLSRATRARRLQRDLDINLAGVGLALDLLEEVETLRRRLRLM